MPGADSTIEHSPGIWANHQPPGSPPHPSPNSPSDAILFHEMNHSTNNAEGMNRTLEAPTEHGWDQRWVNGEEYATTHAENGYRADHGLPQRPQYVLPNLP